MNGIGWVTETESNYVLVQKVCVCEMLHHNMKLKYWFNAGEGEWVRKIERERDSLPRIDWKCEWVYEESRRELRAEINVEWSRELCNYRLKERERTIEYSWFCWKCELKVENVTRANYCQSLKYMDSSAVKNWEWLSRPTEEESVSQDNEWMT